MSASSTVGSTQAALDHYMRERSIKTAMRQGRSRERDRILAVLKSRGVYISKRLAERAQRWRARFEKSTPTGEPEAPRPRTTEEISDALDVAITELARRELIEISARRITHLADELLKVALRAGPVDDLIDRLCKALVDSDRVDEIYADDDEIRKILSDALSAD